MTGETWLGRQDSNLGMAESKSTYFAFVFSVHSDKLSKLRAIPIKRLTRESECPLVPGKPSMSTIRCSIACAICARVLAQRESVPFTRERSQVQSLQRPPFSKAFAAVSGNSIRNVTGR
jgi:hypothetical protein